MQRPEIIKDQKRVLCFVKEPNEIINDPLKSTLFGKFYEKIIETATAKVHDSLVDLSIEGEVVIHNRQY